jgi:HEAT repeat protein
MNAWLGFIMSASLAMIMLPVGNTTANHTDPAPRSEPPVTSVAASCLPELEVSTAVQELATAGNYAKLDQAKKLLLTNARRSPECRKQVIAALMNAMDKANLDLVRDQASFRSWLYGTELLGDLHATEALDLLVAHLDLNDGTSFPLNHHPALVSVIRMGPTAIPKLNAVLSHDPDMKSRRYAAFCIAQIGGPSAVSVLQHALPLESDRCNSSFISASLKALDNKRLPNQITSEDRTKWYSTFLCNE